MKTYKKTCEYTMEKTEDGFVFSVKEKTDFCKIRIDYITEKGAKKFFDTIRDFDVRASQLTCVAEDKALDAVTEIFRGLL